MRFIPVQQYRPWRFLVLLITTVGYGDITPVAPSARTLSWLEAMMGQFYIAVLVASLVGMRLAQRPDVERAEAQDPTSPKGKQ